jgi:hypothetical protein
MIDLDFSCTGAHPDLQAAGPTIALRLHIAETTGTEVYALALRCQLRIEPQRRRYDDTEAEALQDLFGERARWGDTLKPMQLGFISQIVTGFSDETDVELPLPCSYDFDVAAHKYLYGLAGGEIPVLLLFSGMAFAVGEGGISHEPIPWHKETQFRLPVAVWKQAMDLHFPGTAWLKVGTDTFDALHRYRARNAMISWDDAIVRLLKQADSEASDG